MKKAAWAPRTEPRSTASVDLRRRDFLKGAVGGLAGLGLSGCLSSSLEDGDVRPNIVVIVLDALRAQSLPMYGCPRATAPFLASLAETSTVFQRCYSSATWTKPAVTAMLTGLTPFEHGDNRVDSVLPADAPSFPRALKAEGYTTGFFTANLIIADEYGAAHHFDHTASVKPNRLNGFHLMERISSWLEAGPTEPLCVYVHFFQPHAPYNPPEEYVSRMKQEVAERPLSADFLRHYHRDVNMSPIRSADQGRLPPYQTRSHPSTDPLDHLLLYEANVAFADDLVRELFALWNRFNLQERTLFFITGDHGECLGEHGLFAAHGKLLVNQLLHVPLIVHDTGDLGGKIVDAPVSHLDLAPSLAGIGGSKAKIGSIGEPSLFDSRERGGGEDRALVSQFISHDYGIGQDTEFGWALTRGRWRAVYNDCCGLGGANNLEVMTGTDASPDARRGPMPVPHTGIPRPRELAPGVTLEGFALHTAYFLNDTPYRFSGRIGMRSAEPGRLELRLRASADDLTAVVDLEISGSGPFSGELPALSIESRRPDVSGVCEARWTSREGRPEDWRQLLGFPVFRPRNVSGNQDFVFLGAELEPSTALAGGTVHLEMVWRCQRVPEKLPRLSVRLADRRGSSIFRARRTFLPSLIGDRQGRSKPREVMFAGYRFDEVITLAIPADASPGDYSLEIRFGGGSPWETVSGLRVETDALAAFGSLIARDAGLRHFRVLGSDALVSAFKNRGDSSLAAELKARYPDEGQADFLMAMATGEREEKLRRLRACLRRTPHHLGALRELVDELGEAGRARALRKLTPENACDFTFGDMLRLFGYEVYRSPRPDRKAVYVRLFWEALAPMSKALAAEVLTPKELLFWFLGATARPTSQWSVGEAVVETLVMNLPEAGEADDAARFLSRARYVSRDWPGQPTWERIQAVGGSELHMAAWRVGDPDVTRIEMPVEPGGHELTGLLDLRRDATSNTRLELVLTPPGGEPRLLESRLIEPGQGGELALSFDVEHAGSLFTLRYSMAEGATDNHNSNLYVRDFAFQRPAAEEDHDLELDLEVKVYPFWDFIYSGWRRKSLLPVANGGAKSASLGRMRWSQLPSADEDLLLAKRADEESWQLFDLVDDPTETRNVLRENRGVFRGLQGQLIELIERFESSESRFGTVSVDLSDEKVKALEALGYLD